jgi:Domain of unknown function (DUF4190)
MTDQGDQGESMDNPYGQPPPPSYGQPPPPSYGQPPPPSYGQPPPPSYGQQDYGPQPSRATNGMAIASMVLGLVWLCGLGSVLALVFGYMARSQISQRNESGSGFAIAGIVLGWVGVGLLVVYLVLLAIGVVNSSDYSNYSN